MGGPPQVSIDLAELKQIGLYHLREQAKIHSDAAQKLDKVSWAKSGLFDSPVSGESGVKSVSYEKWLELYTIVQKIMENTVDNLVDTGDGIVKAAEAFYDQDMSTSEQLAADGEMDAYENGDKEYQESGGERGEPGFGPPPDKPKSAPAPNDVYEGDELYMGSDG